MIKIAFQGEMGAFSEDAAIKHFGNSIVTVPCKTLDDVFSMVDNDKANYGVVPIENSIEGSITQTYDLIVNYNLEILGEIVLKIVHCLIGNSGSNIKSIKFVYSHPQALAQCKDYLNKLKCEALPTYDTAGSVKMIKERKMKNSAAIASERAAKIYKMKILAKGIESNPNNFTRFLIISKTKPEPTGNDKTSIVFMVKHVPGSLYKSLKSFANNNINLTHIQSRPLVGKPWEYSFYVDLEGHVKDPMVQKTLNQLKKNCVFLKILGSYPKSKREVKTHKLKDCRNIAIIGGAGKMGKWFCNFFLKEGYNLIVSGRNKEKCESLAKGMKVKVARDNIDAVKQADLIIISVLFKNFENVVKEIAPYLKPHQKVIDVTSVKSEPVKIMHKHIKNCLILGTHPLFGPSATDNYHNFVLTPTNRKELKFANELKDFLENRGFKVRIISPEKHDALMSIVLGLSHFIGLTASDTLSKYNIKELEKLAGTSFEIILDLIRKVLSSDSEFYSHLQMVLPNTLDVENEFKRDVEDWIRVISKKDTKEFIRKMETLKNKLLRV